MIIRHEETQEEIEGQFFNDRSPKWNVDFETVISLKIFFGGAHFQQSTNYSDYFYNLKGITANKLYVYLLPIPDSQSWTSPIFRHRLVNFRGKLSVQQNKCAISRWLTKFWHTHYHFELYFLLEKVAPSVTPRFYLYCPKATQIRTPSQYWALYMHANVLCYDVLYWANFGMTA